MCAAIRQITELAGRDDVGRYIGRLLPGAVGAEVGVWDGENAERLFQLAKPSKLYLIDPWHGPEGQKRFERTKSRFPAFRDNIQYVRKRLEDVSLADGSLDWAYLDSNHEYEPTARHLEILTRLVKPGGMIAGHDFVVEPQCWRTSVLRAVIELIQAGRAQMVALSNCRYADFILIRGNS